MRASSRAGIAAKTSVTISKATVLLPLVVRGGRTMLLAVSEVLDARPSDRRVDLEEVMAPSFSGNAAVVEV